MGFLRRLLVAGIVFLQAGTFALTLYVLGEARMLGKAVIMSADDAMVLFVLNAASLVGTVVLSVALWFGGRALRQARRLATVRPSAPLGITAPNRHMVQCPRCGTAAPLSIRFCPHCGLERTPVPE